MGGEMSEGGRGESITHVLLHKQKANLLFHRDLVAASQSPIEKFIT